MTLSPTWKSSIFLLGAASLGGFIGSYLATSPADSQPILDTRDFETLNAKLNLTAQQFMELYKNYEKLATAENQQQTDFNQFQQIWLERLENLETKLDKLSVVNTPALVSPASVLHPEQDTHCQVLQEKLDMAGVEDVIWDMHSEDFNVRQRALRALALVGSAEIKEEIGRIIMDETQDTALRRDLIQSLDWQGLGEHLNNLFLVSKDAVVRAAAVSAVHDSQLSEIEKQTIETSLISNFAEETDDFIRIVTLDYFANLNSPHLHSLANSLNNQDISTQLREHIQFLTTPATF
jgi:hypothetical protein